MAKYLSQLQRKLKVGVSSYTDNTTALEVIGNVGIKTDVAEGWVSLSLQSAGMFFLICLILAMLAEYLFSLLGNAIGYPIYQISSESTSSVTERRVDLSVLDSKDGVVLEDRE